jgi:hypothetical protein
VLDFATGDIIAINHASLTATASFADIAARLTNNADGAIIMLSPEDSISIIGVIASSLTEADFLLL